MQAINRIQNAMINANAGIQGALVVDGANAHRAYPSFEPCDTVSVSKCPGKPSSSLTCLTRTRVRKNDCVWHSMDLDALPTALLAECGDSTVITIKCQRHYGPHSSSIARCAAEYAEYGTFLISDSGEPQGATV